VYGAYDLITRRVRLPLSPPGELTDEEYGLFVPPEDAKGFRQLSLRICGSKLVQSVLSREPRDRFFATVFLGSGLLYVAMLFTAAAIAGALIGLLATDSGSLTASSTHVLGRQEIYRILPRTPIFNSKPKYIYLHATRLSVRFVAACQ
jgi:hypothetical protein